MEGREKSHMDKYKEITKMAVFWVVAPCSLVEVYQRFRNVGKLLPDYTALQQDSHLRTHCRKNLKFKITNYWNYDMSYTLYTLTSYPVSELENFST
jgi:hypothetical protein